MMIANFLIIIVITYYFNYMISLFLPQNRKGIQVTNENLHKLRKVKYKTLEEQKEFLNLRYPKRQPQKKKFTWKKFFNITGSIILFVLIFQIIFFVFKKLNIDSPLWVAILFIVFFPMLFNWILEKFNLQKTDLRLFLR